MASRSSVRQKTINSRPLAANITIASARDSQANRSEIHTRGWADPLCWVLPSGPYTYKDDIYRWTSVEQALLFLCCWTSTTALPRDLRVQLARPGSQQVSTSPVLACLYLRQASASDLSLLEWCLVALRQESKRQDRLRYRCSSERNRPREAAIGIEPVIRLHDLFAMSQGTRLLSFQGLNNPVRVPQQWWVGLWNHLSFTMCSQCWRPCFFQSSARPAF